MSTVKYLHSGLVGSPVLSGTAGAMIALLDACLKDGWGAQTLDSLSVTSSVATATRAAGHNFEVHSIALIAGATPSGLNGDKRVLSVTATTYTFDATGISNQTATGTITHQFAPAGWTKPYSGTNLAMYTGHASGTQNLLRIDDTGTTNARAVGYVSATGISSGLLDAYPLTTAHFWPKSATANSTARAWHFVGDTRGFTLFVSWGNGSGGVYFGDLQSAKSPDPYSCICTGPQSDIVGVGVNTWDISYCGGNTALSGYLARDGTGLGINVTAYRNAVAPGVGAANYSGVSATDHFKYPNPANNGIYVGQVSVKDTSLNYRGLIPGLYYCPQGIGSLVFGTKNLLDSFTGLTGRTLVAQNNGTGVAFFDVTGPWAR